MSRVITTAYALLLCFIRIEYTQSYFIPKSCKTTVARHGSRLPHVRRRSLRLGFSSRHHPPPPGPSTAAHHPSPVVRHSTAAAPSTLRRSPTRTTQNHNSNLAATTLLIPPHRHRPPPPPPTIAARSATVAAGADAGVAARPAQPEQVGPARPYIYPKQFQSAVPKV
jgi:hypothetical protein